MKLKHNCCSTVSQQNRLESAGGRSRSEAACGKNSEPTLYLWVTCSPVFVFAVLAVYLSQRWWPVEDVVKTVDPSRDGLILVRMLF